MRDIDEMMLKPTTSNKNKSKTAANKQDDKNMQINTNQQHNIANEVVAPMGEEGELGEKKPENANMFGSKQQQEKFDQSISDLMGRIKTVNDQVTKLNFTLNRRNNKIVQDDSTIIHSVLHEAGEVSGEVDKWTRFLGIEEYIDRASGSYSGGNKRKLNVAMSLVAEPPVIFLDEPSTGVDPVARRNLWKIIQQIQAAGQSVILTSHSMEECEALCDRLAIMVNGQFQCFGTVNHLKNKFALGFTILTKLKVMGES